MAAVFVFGGDRQHFYRPKLDGWDSSKNLALAENLSPATFFRLYRQLEFDGRDRDPIYEMYGRFPVGGPLLIKIVGLPFGDDLSGKILAARALMLVFYAAAALLAFRALTRIFANRWAALAATLMAFSSYYVLYYSDTVSNEMSVDLFAISLVFHGMVVFVQEGRFRQLAVKSCAALLLGWHVYALLLPFIIIGFGAEAATALRLRLPMRLRRAQTPPDGETAGGGRRRRRRRRGREPQAEPRLAAAARLVRSRYLVLGAVTLLFGMGVLGFNLMNEYAAYGGRVSFSELPAVQSLLARTGQSDEHNARHTDFQNWRTFLNQQLYRAGVTALPYALTRWSDDSREHVLPEEDGFSVVVIGILSIAAAAAAIWWFRRHWLLLATLALFGFFWAIPMRSSTAFHEFEGMFYLGLPMVAFAAAVVGAADWARQTGGELAARWTAVGCAALALILFAVSAVWMSEQTHDESAEKFHEEIVSDFETVREITRGESVFVSPSHLAGDGGARDLYFGGAKFAPEFYLAGSVLQTSFGQTPHNHARYVLSAYRNDSFAPITPENKRVFLYEGVNVADLYWADYESATAGTRVGEPESDTDFAVYLDDRGVHFAKEGCGGPDTAGYFFLEFVLETSETVRAEYEFERSGKMFTDHVFGGRCLLSAALPSAPFTGLRAGQWDGAELWRAEAASASAAPLRPPAALEVALEVDAGATDADLDEAQLAALREKAAALADETPLARMLFDMHLGEDGLTYLKDPCAPADVRGRFKLSVYPVHLDDLSEKRRPLANDDLSFAFGDYGAVFDGKCLATVPLPDYPIKGLEVGQWISGERSLWYAAAGAPLDAAALDFYREEYRLAQRSRVLAATVNFDIYLNDGVLYYLKDECDEDDTRPRFLLSVFPKDAADLSTAGANGGEPLNFSFPLFGAYVDGGCIVRRPLPEYPIAAIETGQWMPGGSTLWKIELALSDD